MFAGHDAVLSGGRDFYVTVLGGTSVRRPPTASLVSQLLRGSPGQPDHPQCTFVTVFGGTSLMWPTLSEEYLALRDALQAGSLTLEDWDRLAVVAGGGGPVRILSLTLFGSFEGDQLPREEKELDDLALQRHLGEIPESAVQILTMAIGQRGHQRLTAVRQAIVSGRSAGGGTRPPLQPGTPS